MTDISIVQKYTPAPEGPTKLVIIAQSTHTEQPFADAAGAVLESLALILERMEQEEIDETKQFPYSGFGYTIGETADVDINIIDHPGRPENLVPYFLGEHDDAA